MPFVMDCSVTMAWLFEDEENAYADAILDRLAIEPAIVPALWALEVANTIVVGERRGRIERQTADRFLALISRLPIYPEEVPAERALGQVPSLAREWKLSAYDAVYLDVALRRGVPIATGDTKLRPAALAVGVPILDATGRT